MGRDTKPVQPVAPACLKTTTAPVGQADAKTAPPTPGPAVSHRRAIHDERRPADPEPIWTPDSFQVPPQPGKIRFHDLGIPDSILHAVADQKFSYCTPIQAQILPALLAGRDAGGRAQTGTGKTAAFLIGIFAHLIRHPLTAPGRSGMPRALVLAPTRELALQIFKDAQELGKYGRLRNLVIFGGMDYKKQQDQLRSPNIDLIVATPGRLLDFRSSGLLNLGRVEVLVLDEADRMLDMGFIPDVKRIVYSLPHKDRRQTMLFSATLSQDILGLASRWMKNPLLIEIEPDQVTLQTTEQRVYTVTARDKFGLLYNLIQREPVTRMLVFRNRRDGVDRLARKLTLAGVPCAQLSGEVPQEKRIRILEDFRAGKIKVVIATDVAGRGIHVEAISHVVNYDIPEDAEDYVHRIGRTGRAGATGIAITFACEEGAFNVPAIEEYIGRALACIQPEESWLKLPQGMAPKVAAGVGSRAPFRRPRLQSGGGSRRRR